MSNKKGKGLLGLITIGLGALAFWKYNKMTPEEKESLKAKVNDAGKKIKDTAEELETNITHKYEELKTSAKKGMDELKDETT